MELNTPCATPAGFFETIGMISHTSKRGDRSATCVVSVVPQQQPPLFPELCPGFDAPQSQTALHQQNVGLLGVPMDT